jgi:hypothetical protein
MQLDRRTVLEGLVGVTALAMWPACRTDEKNAKREGFLAGLPPDALNALTAAVECVLPGSTAVGAMIFIDYWLQQRTISNLQNVFLKGGLVLNMAARKRYQKVFAACSGEEQDEVLKAMSAGTAHPSFDSKGFLERLITFTLEGFLGHPKYGGNQGKAGWDYIGWDPCWWSPKKVGHLVERDERLPY